MIILLEEEPRSSQSLPVYSTTRASITTNNNICNCVWTLKKLLVVFFFLTIGASVFNTAQVARIFVEQFYDHDPNGRDDYRGDGFMPDFQHVVPTSAHHTRSLANYHNSYEEQLEHILKEAMQKVRNVPVPPSQPQEQQQILCSSTGTTSHSTNATVEGQGDSESSKGMREEEEEENNNQDDDTDNDKDNDKDNDTDNNTDNDTDNVTETKTTTPATATTKTSTNTTSPIHASMLLPRKVPERSWETENFLQMKKKRPLNFVHIPKNGGSSIVEAGIQAGLSWGDCLFQQKWPGRTCPTEPPHGEWPAPKNDPTGLGRVWWHLPLQHLPKKTEETPEFPSQNPYKGYDLFAVVRNPYDRAVSEFYYTCKINWGKCQGLYGRDESGNYKPRAKRMLNHQIQLALKKALLAKENTPEYLNGMGHWIPQYDFFFANRGKRYIKHLLHLETLHEEFDSLMKAYRYDKKYGVTLPDQKVKSRHEEEEPPVSVYHLTLKTLKLIEAVYEKDFVLGDYPMLSLLLAPEDIYEYSA